MYIYVYVHRDTGKGVEDARLNVSLMEVATVGTAADDEFAQNWHEMPVIEHLSYIYVHTYIHICILCIYI